MAEPREYRDGDRVEFTPLAYHNGVVKEGKDRFATVRGKSRDPRLVRVVRDGHRIVERYARDFVRRTRRAAAPTGGE